MVLLALVLLEGFALISTRAFSVNACHQGPNSNRRATSCPVQRCSTTPSFSDWESLTAPSERGIWKEIQREGTGDYHDKDAVFTIKYRGTLVGEQWWTPQDVVDCWIKELQGMESCSEAILREGVGGSQLLDPNLFTEDFVSNHLGIVKKMQCKKLVMAAKRLQHVRNEFPIGTVFDSSESYAIDKKKRIVRGMRRAIESMKVGEKATIICRSDYCYGAEGIRRNNGQVVVPPFATLCFEISLLNCKLQ